MRGPQPLAVVLTETERAALDRFGRRHTTPQQLARRARIVLAAAAGQTNAQIARDCAVAIDTVRLWRRRWVDLQPIPAADLALAERLADAPRPGKPVRITAAQVCQIIELACAAPAQAGRPISQWTGREIADEIMARGIVDQISDRHAARLLKRGACNPIAGVTG
jgi:putative transposase